jgi:hypothetical protein
MSGYTNPWGKDTIYVRMENDTVKTFSLSYSRTIENLKFPRQIFSHPFKPVKSGTVSCIGLTATP